MKETIKLLRWLAYGCGTVVLAIVAGIKNVTPAIELLVNLVLGGVEGALYKISGPVSIYFRGLRILFRVTFLLPLPFIVLGIFTGWLQVVGWAGVWCLVWSIFLAKYLIPLGLAIDALARGTKESPVSLKRYLSSARTVLMYETLALFILSVITVKNNLPVLPAFALGIAFLIFSGYQWESKTGVWLKPLLRTVVFAIVGLQLLSFKFPQISPMRLVIRVVNNGKIPEGVPTTPEALTDEHVWKGMERSFDWFYANLEKPKFWVGVVAVVLLGFLLVKLFQKATTPAGAVAVTATTSGKSQDIWKWLAVGAALLCIVLLAMKFMGGGPRYVVVERQVEAPRVSLATPVSAPIAKPANGNGQVAKSTTPEVEIECGLKNHTKKTVPYTTEWSRPITRPYRHLMMYSPDNLRPEILSNGSKIIRVNPDDGTFRFYQDTRYFQVRCPDGETPSSEKITMMVGPKA